MCISKSLLLFKRSNNNNNNKGFNAIVKSKINNNAPPSEKLAGILAFIGKALIYIQLLCNGYLIRDRFGYSSGKMRDEVYDISENYRDKGCSLLYKCGLGLPLVLSRPLSLSLSSIPCLPTTTTKTQPKTLS
tara:strand:- start:969 stop:1364 length:396 start_codon:yes stop_codon:yes gene_type:complete